MELEKFYVPVFSEFFFFLLCVGFFLCDHRPFHHPTIWYFYESQSFRYRSLTFIYKSFLYRLIFASILHLVLPMRVKFPKHFSSLCVGQMKFLNLLCMPFFLKTSSLLTYNIYVIIGIILFEQLFMTELPKLNIGRFLIRILDEYWHECN